MAPSDDVMLKVLIGLARRAAGRRRIAAWRVERNAVSAPGETVAPEDPAAQRTQRSYSSRVPAKRPSGGSARG